ncbi:hypothetical protein PFISCL1PPCAC_12593 [Pristionchus fissidentatus]|uniref:Ankyrin repeat-containing protein n=1 Tax=Pristionchus fissidentatus TaxID=1538716 RepID=A0AAV5VPC5_9BILA|nr:hypothetical protein PFISCL1PPCAC_12593 [Pristionchus fissidentatus]
MVTNIVTSDDKIGEFYCVAVYSRGALDALRYGHCGLALDLGKCTKTFSPLAECILQYSDDATIPFESNAGRDEKSSTPTFFLPIHASAARGNLEILEWFNETYYNSPHLLDGENWTPLHYAAASETVHAVRFILTRGGEVNLKNKDGHTALHVAVKAGRAENVEVLMDTIETHLDRSCINFKTNKGNTALHHAARGGNVDIVKSLCHHPHVDVYLKNDEGLSPLMVAASFGHYECVEFLSGIMSPQLDQLKRDALIHAAINGQTRVLGFLLRSNTCNHDTCDALRVLLRLAADSEDTGRGHYGIVCWFRDSGCEKFVKNDPDTGEDIETSFMDWVRNHDDEYRKW